MPEIETMNQQPLPVFVDTDIGDDIDDALALALVLDSPELQLVGVSTVFGDTHLRARLASTLLSVSGKAALCVPHLFHFERLPVRVLARGLFAGFTIPRILGGKAVWAATWVDCDAAKDWMTRRWLL